MVKQLSNCLFQRFSDIKSSAVIRGKDRLTLTLHVVLYETVTTSVAEKYLGSIQTEGKCGPNPILMPICNLYSRQGTAVWTNRSHLSDFTSLKCDKQFCLWGGGANRFRPIGMIMPCWEAAAYGKMFFLSFKKINFFSPKLFLKMIWLLWLWLRLSRILFLVPHSRWDEMLKYQKTDFSTILFWIVH